MRKQETGWANRFLTVISLSFVVKLDKRNSLVGSGVSVLENAAFDNVAELQGREKVQHF